MKSLRLGRFGLKTLLIATACACIWLAYVCEKGRDAKSLRTRVSALGGVLGYTHTVEWNGAPIGNPRHPIPAFIRDWIGDDFGVTPYSINLSGNLFGRRVSDDEIVFLESNRSARSVRLLDLARSKITDASLARISKMPMLIYLDIAQTEISENGLEPLCKLKELESLNASHTRIDDNSIDSLARMKSLRALIIAKTRMSIDGANRLRNALPNCEVFTDYETLFGQGP